MRMTEVHIVHAREYSYASASMGRDASSLSLAGDGGGRRVETPALTTRRPVQDLPVLALPPGRAARIAGIRTFLSLPRP